VTAGWTGLFWAAFKRSRNAMVLVDEGRSVVEVNGAFINVVLRPRAALIGRPVYEWIDGGPQLSDEEWRAALDQGDAFGRIVLLRGDGTRVGLEYAAHPDRVSGRQLVLFVVVSVDRRRRSVKRRRDTEPGDLTDREREIIGLVAHGASGPDIAADLQISYATVRTHIRNAQAKLGAQSRAQLVAMTMGEGHLARR
jgi:DNA-binding CsgD family transcriptional regulator